MSFNDDEACFPLPPDLFIVLRFSKLTATLARLRYGSVMRDVKLAKGGTIDWHGR